MCFSDSLGGHCLIQGWESSKRTQSKISKEKSHVGQRLEETKHEFLGVLTHTGRTSFSHCWSWRHGRSAALGRSAWETRCPALSLGAGHRRSAECVPKFQTPEGKAGGQHKPHYFPSSLGPGNQYHQLGNGRNPPQIPNSQTPAKGWPCNQVFLMTAATGLLHNSFLHSKYVFIPTPHMRERRLEKSTTVDPWITRVLKYAGPFIHGFFFFQ